MNTPLITFLAAITGVILCISVGFLLYWNRLLAKSLREARKRTATQTAIINRRDTELHNKNAELSLHRPRAYTARHRFDRTRLDVMGTGDAHAEVTYMIQQLKDKILDDIVWNARIETTNSGSEAIVDLRCYVSVVPLPGGTSGYNVGKLGFTAMEHLTDAR